MTSKAEWIALAERCEKATAASSVLSKDIVAAMGYSWRGMAYWSDDNRTTWVGSVDLTYSLDAITALIERELPEVRWVCRTDTLGGFGNLYRRRNPDRSWPCFAFTPALALCAAFCRAMAEKVTT